MENIFETLANATKLSNMNTTAKRKWFYSAVELAAKQLQERYEHISCQFQEVTPNRIIEMWKCQLSDNDESETVFITITKSGAHHANLMFWKAEFLSGRPVDVS